MLLSKVTASKNLGDHLNEVFGGEDGKMREVGVLMFLHVKFSFLVMTTQY